MQLAAFVGAHLLAFALLAATAWVAGRLVLRRLEGLEGFAVSTALGLTLLAHLGFLLGSLGLLTRGLLIAALVAIHVFGFPIWREHVGAGLAPAREGVNPSPTSLKTALGLALAAAPLFVLALYPPTAFDETLYHLPYARAFARTGGIPFLPELRYPIFPQLDELLFTGMFLLAGDVATHLVQLLATLVTAALLVAWGGRSGWLAAAVFLGNPIVVHLAGTAYVEPALTLFATAAVYSLERWRETRATSWLVLLGVFAGSAAAVKYLGLFFVAAVLAALLPAAIRERRLRDLAVASAAALAVLAPWYGRLVLETGNPLFPFYPEIFGPNPWVPDSALRGTLAERAVAYLRFPWDVLFERGAVGTQPPWSPALLLGLPLLAYGLVRDPRVRRILAIALAYSLFFFILPPDSRYMTAVLPLVSLALAAILSRWPLRRWVPAVLALVLFLPGWAYGIYRIGRQGPLPATALERDAYLTRKLPAYAAVDHLNDLRGERYTAYAFFAEPMVYHADGTLLGDWSGPARFSSLYPVLKDPELLHRRLREMGADYLLVMRGKGVRLPEGDRRFRRIYSDRWAEVYQIP